MRTTGCEYFQIVSKEEYVYLKLLIQYGTYRQFNNNRLYSQMLSYKMYNLFECKVPVACDITFSLAVSLDLYIITRYSKLKVTTYSVVVRDVLGVQTVSKLTWSVQTNPSFGYPWGPLQILLTAVPFTRCLRQKGNHFLHYIIL